MPKYQGGEVTILRDATPSDAGFDQSKDQVVVRKADGVEAVVERSELDSSGDKDGR